MGVLNRRKKQGVNGFKDYVKGLETAPKDKQTDIIQVSILDDPIYTDWAHRNLLSLEKLKELNEDEIQALILALPNIQGILARAFYNNKKAEEQFINLLPLNHQNKFQEEKKYLPSLTDGECESAAFLIYKKLRELQEAGDITSIVWKIPPIYVLEIQKPQVSSGKWELHHENGKISAYGELVNYEKCGKWEHFYPTGDLMAKGQYRKDKKIGKWVYFFHNGKIMAEGDFEGDQKIGQWTFYDQKGDKKIRKAK